MFPSFTEFSTVYYDLHSQRLAAAAAKSLQLCLILCDPIDCSPPGFPGPGILQARTLEWVCHFLLQCMKVKSESEVSQSCPTLSDPMASSLPGSSIRGFSRQEYWSAMPLPSPVKDFGIVNKAEIDVFLELSCFLMNPAEVGNLISGSSTFSKTSLNIWKFTVHVLLKPGLESFEH